MGSNKRIMLLLQAIPACILITLTLLSTSVASSSYGGGIQQQQEPQEGKNFGRFLIKDIEDLSPADRWKLVRLEQMLESLDSSIPAPAVVYQREQGQQHPSSQLSAALQYSNGGQAASGDDNNNMLDGSSSRRALMGLVQSPLSVQTRQVSDADTDSNEIDSDSADASYKPRSQMMHSGQNTGLDGSAVSKSRAVIANRNSNNNKQQLVATDLGGIVFTKQPGAGSPTPNQQQQFVTAPYYNARGRGAAMQQRRGTGALTAASLDELREGSLERPPRRMALTGSEEVPVEPVHSQSNEWDSKRAPASTRWYDFRGMWGKRNAM